ncbi:hypothetical protein PsorP6_007990 [Peronosclerospora sorghi]|uniref:Uncharacterized protein n=1 Tax=Peronosclerospora sorghi TaxID=230839 RepID=A0ACC0WBW7_9STRA|nr:hypothetical protein PsorP6_007990 [Peronosclerospora sorghi]
MFVVNAQISSGQPTMVWLGSSRSCADVFYGSIFGICLKMDKTSYGFNPDGHRHRSYSNLASEKDVREPSVSDPYLSSSRRGRASYDSKTAPSKTDQKDVRPSCFGSHRASNAVVVPHAGWVLIQRGAFRTWKRYYAVISGTEFKYSKGRMEYVRYGLCLEFGDGDMLQIRCPSDHEYDEWLAGKLDEYGRLKPSISIAVAIVLAVYITYHHKHQHQGTQGG